MFHRTWQIIRKEFIQMFRDVQMIRLVIIIPVIQLFLFGYVVTTDIKNLETALCDLDKTTASRDLIARFTSSGYFKIVRYADDFDELGTMLDSGDAKVAIGIPVDFEKAIKKGRKEEVLILIDGTNSNTATIAANYAARITETYNSNLVFAKLESLGIRIRGYPPLESEERIWFNPDLKSVRYMVPGIICVLLMQLLVPLTSMGIVKEKERGTMEQIIVTPIRSIELIIGKTLPFAVLGYINILIIMAIGTFWFDVDIKGSIVLLLLLSGVFMLAALGTGLFISTVSRNRQQAMMTGQFIIVPNLLLSGFMFPIASMPELLQYVTYIIPLRYFLIIVRGIFLKGSGIYELWDQIVPLIIFALVTIVLSAARFRKRLS